MNYLYKGHSHSGSGHKKNIGVSSDEGGMSEETQPLPNGHISTVTGDEEAESSEDEVNPGHSDGNKNIKLSKNLRIYILNLSISLPNQCLCG